jgi:hypothetical protein
MNLIIEGGTQEKQDLCKDFAHHAVKNICGSRLYNVIDLELQLLKGLEENYHQSGNCVHLDDDIRPREFEIEVDADLTPRFMLTTLAHEIVHLKQLAKGELRFYSNSDVKWHSQVLKKSKPGNRKYARLPWEIEAVGLEEALFREWVEDSKITDSWVMLPMFDTA